MSKELWGWNTSLQKELEIRKPEGVEAGRIIKDIRHRYVLSSTESTTSGESLVGEVSGGFH
ncbi:MAG: hypothetical protein JEY99_04350 [Spirochaetales bacterium]|nr:hypothetical protein [Spirochaetales bacterium]